MDPTPLVGDLDILLKRRLSWRHLKWLLGTEMWSCIGCRALKMWVVERMLALTLLPREGEFPEPSLYFSQYPFCVHLRGRILTAPPPTHFCGLGESEGWFGVGLENLQSVLGTFSALLTAPGVTSSPQKNCTPQIDFQTNQSAFHIGSSCICHLTCKQLWCLWPWPSAS